MFTVSNEITQWWFQVILQISLILENIQGVKGLFAMELEGDKGAFVVQPTLVTDAGDIKIKVKNSFLLDYEKTQQMNFRVSLVIVHKYIPNEFCRHTSPV